MSCCCFSDGFAAPAAGIGSTPFVASLPEQWAQNDIAANQTATPLQTQVSTSFDDFQTIRDGFLVGVGTRISEAITAGILTIDITVNGAVSGVTISHTSITNSTGGVERFPLGFSGYVAEDLIGVIITTSVDFAPITADIEVTVQVVEPIGGS